MKTKLKKCITMRYYLLGSQLITDSIFKLHGDQILHQNTNFETYSKGRKKTLPMKIFG